MYSRQEYMVAYDIDVEVTKERIREVFKNVSQKNVGEKINMTQ